MSLQRRPVPGGGSRQILEMIGESLASGKPTLGPIGVRFEYAFAHRYGVDDAVAVPSDEGPGVVLRALGVDGCAVIVPANTFQRTAAAVIGAGATPRCADCDPATLALDPDSVAALIGARTAAVVVVHRRLNRAQRSRPAGAVRGIRLRPRRGRRIRPRRAARLPGCRYLWSRRSVLLRPDQGDRRRQRGTLVTGDQWIAERADLPRRGEGFVPDQTCAPAWGATGDERAACGDPLSQLPRLDGFIQAAQ